MINNFNGATNSTEAIKTKKSVECSPLFFIRLWVLSKVEEH